MTQSGDVSTSDVPTDFVVDASRLPLTDVDGEQVLRMFWLDAYEDSYKQPGTYGAILYEYNIIF